MLLCLVFFAVLAVLPEPFSLWKTAKNVYRQFPFYQIVEKEAQEAWKETDPGTTQIVVQAGREYVQRLNQDLREAADAKVDEPESGSEGNGDAEAVEQEKSGESAGRETELKGNEIAGNRSIGQETSQVEAENTGDESIGQETPPAEAENSGDESAGQETPPVEAENNSTKPTDGKTTETVAVPHPELDLSPEKLADPDFLLGHFYIIDENTDISAVDLDASRFLAEDMHISRDTEGPQILIYHSHSQETFCDSRKGIQDDTIVGVGDYLTSLLTKKYGYQVLHITDQFDLAGGELDRNAAYDYARERVEEILKKNPSIEVLIDLHRDGVAEGKRLVTQINGKDTAKIMFFNGISHTISQGAVEYLPNPYIEDNLAFSFQLEYQAALYYPSFYRGIYLAGLRYNLHLRPKSLLVEAGAQTNTVQEVKNAMEPLADILNRVLE